MYSLFGFFVGIVLIAQGVTSNALSDEKRLIKHLLENYERVGTVGRPVFNTSETVRVSFGVALIHLLEVDEANQVLTTNLWERYSWNDLLLKWNPEDFGGIDHIRVPSDKIWNPDIVLYNRAVLSRRSQSMAVISSNGHVLWIPHTIHQSICSMDLYYYPRDTQKCHLKFGSWTYDGFKVNVDFYDNLEEVDVTDYVTSTEWKLKEHPARKNIKHYPCCEEPYPDLTFYLTFERMTGGYEYRVTFPVISLMLLMVFFLPPKSTIKLYLAMFVFLVYLALMLHIVNQFPAGVNRLPFIMYLPATGMALCMISMILSIIIINIASKGRYGVRMPQVFKGALFGFLRTICCLCYNEPADKNNPDESIEKEWEILAMILDRLFFVVYTVVFVIIMIVFSAK